LDITANAFLYHMVRNIAGSLMKVGKGEVRASWIAEVLEARDRDAAGVTAAADGLYFVKAVYPKSFGLPSAVRPFPFVRAST
jgi:tRNA pseudouridine38-40 synthase